MRITRFIVAGLLASLLGSCSAYTQTSSGQDWLAAYPPPPDAKVDRAGIDARVRQAAAVEPTLRFPARIGIARIGVMAQDSRFAGPRVPGLIPLPAPEASAWEQLKTRLGPGFGEFVPISPLIAAMVEDGDTGPAVNRIDPARRLVDTIRLAAARQHLDAVLIYEVDATADAHNTPLSIADWTLIGALILPTQDVKAVGVAQAMLIDVRNGYPYGQVTSTADDNGASARFATGDAKAELSQKVAGAAVDKLAGETEGMMRKLKLDLAALDSKRVVN